MLLYNIVYINISIFQDLLTSKEFTNLERLYFGVFAG